MGTTAAAWAAVSAVTTAAGAGIQAYSQYQSGKATEIETGYQSDIANRNAQVAEQNAKIVEDTARQNARDRRDQANRIKATNRAWLAESGAPAGGSPLKAASYSAGQLEKDLETAFVNDLTEADRWRNQAVVDRMQSRSFLQQGRNARRASNFRAGSTILTGASRTYGIIYEYGLFKKNNNGII